MPSYANIFMAKIDKVIKSLATKYNTRDNEDLRLFIPFLDDYFMLFIGSTKDLHKHIEEANKMNPNMQLIMNHTFIENEAPEDKCDRDDKSAIPFLDTLISIKEGRIEVDLYKN